MVGACEENNLCYYLDPCDDLPTLLIRELQHNNARCIEKDSTSLDSLYFELRDVRRSGFTELALADKNFYLKPKTVIKEIAVVK